MVSLAERAAPHHLFGLAPAGVCPATHITVYAVSSYLTISPLPALGMQAVCFLWHFPSHFCAQVLPGGLLFGVRTFLAS